ncbi:hypothetical protein GF386_05855 [Candidatus Pacearchaeota archaeon]|nr:hypothetical protein [Candidatus Pacearchaeota archaeon]MBD3283618.1 hypothetical protein [Candidatus Pacearchaeota archaeon]
MVSSVHGFDDWDNPPRVEDEDSELAQLLKDYSQGDIEYKGTTEADIERAETELRRRFSEDPDSVDMEVLKDHYHLLADYCFGNVVNTTGHEQIFYFRRGWMVLNMLDKLDDKGKGLRKMIARLLREKRGQ